MKRTRTVAAALAGACALLALRASGACAAFFPDPGLPAGSQWHLSWVSAQPLLGGERLRVTAMIVAGADEQGAHYSLDTRIPYHAWPQSPLEYLFTRRPFSADVHAVLRVEDGKLVSRETTFRRDGADRSRLHGRDIQRVDFRDGIFFDPYFRVHRRLPDDTYDAYTALMVGFLGAGFDGPQTFSVWNNTFPSVVIRADVDGTESIAVPAGTFSCYRVRFTQLFEESFRSIHYREHPHDSVARMAAQFARQIGTVVTNTGWFRVQPPHILVRVDGIVGADSAGGAETLVLESLESPPPRPRGPMAQVPEGR